MIVGPLLVLCVAYFLVYVGVMKGVVLLFSWLSWLSADAPG